MIFDRLGIWECRLVFVLHCLAITSNCFSCALVAQHVFAEVWFERNEINIPQFGPGFAPYLSVHKYQSSTLSFVSPSALGV